MAKKTQLLTLSLITTLLFLTPLLSSSFRSTYLYFIINVLIISIGIEAGLLSPTTCSSSSSSPIISKNPEENNTQMRSTPNSLITPKPKVDINSARKVKVVEKSVSEKIIGVVKISKKVMKKCSSTPSIFFIGNADNGEEEVEEKRVVVVEEEVEEDLFVKAEVFIGNFYKQLKMQREKSWRRIHGIY